MKSDLLVEIGTEEIPAGYIAPALAALEERLNKALDEAGLAHGRASVWATPRRLALAVWGLADRQPDTVKEVTGPPVKAAFDANGQPTKAAEGFARGQGVEVTALKTLDTPKGPYLAVRKEIQGRESSDLLVEILPPLLLGLPWPKSMRWGRGKVTFVRPIHWILAVLGGRVLPLSIGAITAGNVSYGHRFLHPGPVEIRSADDYEEALSRAHVVARSDHRKEMVRREIDRVVAESGQALRPLPDEDLVDEVANLVEIPVAILGGFDEGFLKLPSDVLVTAMREHQRYFALADDQGRLRPYFIAINNTRARDMDVVRRGHERVLRARLDDARFYFEEDRKRPLADLRDDLRQVVFHQLMGTSWQKVERFRDLAAYLSDLLDPEVKEHVLRAAELCKCDLVTGVVGEFPTLQGIMGREYALADGEPEEVARAVYEHYLPIRAGGDLPQSSAGAILSIADKIDTITGCFGVGLIPSGAADPFALRRQALGIINIILQRGYRLSLGELTDQALARLRQWLKRPEDEVRADVLEFFRLRLKNRLTGQGASTDGAEAVLVLHHDDLVASEARVWALEGIRTREDFGDLATAFKRVVNIIKKFGAQDEFDPDLLNQDEEQSLRRAVEDVEKEIAGAQMADDYAGLLTRIVSLKPAVDGFFDHVLVDDPDPRIKKNRLALLTRVSGLFEQIADFSRIST